MEVIKTSVIGQKIYTKEFKRLVCEKRQDKNWTWLRTAEWVEEEYDIKIPIKTVENFGGWYRAEQKGHVRKSSSEGYNMTKRWRPQEDVILKECVEEGLTRPQIVDFMQGFFELHYRTYTLGSISMRKQRLGLIVSDDGRSNRNARKKDCKKLLQKQSYSLVEYVAAANIKVQCDSCNYEWKTEKVNFERTSCPICSPRVPGGIRTGPEPALVYLLYFKEIDKYKPGYAEIGKSSFPEEAIHRTSKSRKYPWSYEIVAYDLSTKTNAGIHEQNLLNDTLDSKVFIEPQGFDGWTEFRTPETIKQLKKKGEFETWLI